MSKKDGLRQKKSYVEAQSLLAKSSDYQSFVDA